MKLVIDIGNSRIKWGTVSNEQFSFGGALSYQGKNIDALLAQTWSHLQPSHIAAVNVGSEQVANLLSKFVKAKWQQTLLFINPQLAAYGVKNNYATPLVLGADRWAAVVAARQLRAGPFCVFACGTAISTDIVNPYGELVGGTISPGLSLMCDSLVTRAAQLKPFQSTFFETGKHYSVNLEEKDTKTSIISGALLTAIAFLEQSAITLGQQYGSTMSFFITGGDVEFLLPHLSALFEHYPHLNLQGVNLLSK